MREALVLAILFLVWLAWRTLNKAALKDPWSPFNLLFYFWVAPLIASFLMWSRLQEGLRPEGAMLILAATAILLAGCLVPMWFLRGQSLQDALCRFGSAWEGTPGFRIVTVVFFLITLVATLAAEFRQGIPLIQYANVTAIDSDLHRFGKDSKLQFLAGGLGIAGLLSFYTAVNSGDRRTRWIFYGMAAVPPLLGVLKTSKSDIFDALFYYVILYFYSLRAHHRKFPLRKLATWLLIAVVVFTGLTALRLSGDSRNPTLTYSGLVEFKYADAIPWPWTDALAIPYGYTALNFENLGRFMQYSNGRAHWGSSMLRPLLSATLNGPIAREMVDEYQANYHELSGAANMGTYLRDLYFEGGTLFCIVGTLLYTALINIVYLQFRRRSSPLWMCIYLNFLFAWIWIGFNNFFAVLTIYANATFMVIVVVAGALVDKLVERQSASPVGVGSTEVGPVG